MSEAMLTVTCPYTGAELVIDTGRAGGVKGQYTGEEFVIRISEPGGMPNVVSKRPATLTYLHVAVVGRGFSHSELFLAGSSDADVATELHKCWVDDRDIPDVSVDHKICKFDNEQERGKHETDDLDKIRGIAIFSPDREAWAAAFRTATGQ